MCLSQAEEMYCCWGVAVTVVLIQCLLLSTAQRDANRISNSCPGYRRGVNPGSRPLEGCVTGNKVIGPVDHEQAFGLIRDLDLRSCNLPEYPTAKYVYIRKPIAYNIYLNATSITITKSIIKGYTRPLLYNMASIEHYSLLP